MILLKSLELDNFNTIPRSTSITILPEEIIFNILVLLPADVLYNVMRRVCRQWHRIIEDPQFVSTHLLLSSSNLLLFPDRRTHYHLLEVRECHAKPSDLKFHLPSIYSIFTCNGLMLIVKKSELLANFAYYVGNPITRRMLALPWISLPIFPDCTGLAFEASSKVYKVVVIYCTSDKCRTNKCICEPDSLDLGCAILTVGVDKAWRVLNCAHLTKEDMELFNGRPPLTSTEFVYWVPRRTLYMLVLDLKSESIKRISLPFAHGGTYFFNYLPKGNSITVWYATSNFSMEAWLLKDHINEEWVKLLYIDGKPIRNELVKVMSPKELNPLGNNHHRVLPRCWLENGDKILFHAGCCECNLFVYDLKTRGFCQVDVEYGESITSFIDTFVKSLAWVC